MFDRGFVVGLILLLVIGSVAAEVYTDLSYGSDPYQKLDLYVPEGDPKPLVVYIHGGGFLWGDKGDETPLYFSGLLNERGYAFASINYRLMEGFPAPTDDVSSAVSWLKDHYEEYGYTKEFAIIGASAGGHLSSFYGTTEGSSVDAVIDISGVTNLYSLAEYCRDHPLGCWDCIYWGCGSVPSQYNNVLDMLLGCNPLESASCEQKALRYSAVGHASSDDPPFLVMHGDADVIVPYYQGLELHEALSNAGGDSTLVIPEGYGHAFTFFYDVNDPYTRTFLGFLTMHLGDSDPCESVGGKCMEQECSEYTDCKPIADGVCNSGYCCLGDCSGGGDGDGDDDGDGDGDDDGDSDGDGDDDGDSDDDGDGDKVVHCTCTCKTKEGSVEIEEVSLGEENCLAKCGGVCGGLASCGLADEDCDECCNTFCESTDNSFSGNNDAVARCKQVCKGKCRFNISITDIYKAIMLASIILGALIFAVCGIRFILADDVETKEKSKRCLIYVIAGLIIIGAAVMLVDLIWEPGLISDRPDCVEAGGKCMEKPCSSYDDCTTVSGTCESGYCCTGECTGGGDIEVDVRVDLFTP